MTFLTKCRVWEESFICNHISESTREARHVAPSSMCKSPKPDGWLVSIPKWQLKLFTWPLWMAVSHGYRRCVVLNFPWTLAWPVSNPACEGRHEWMFLFTKEFTNMNLPRIVKSTCRHDPSSEMIFRFTTALKDNTEAKNVKSLPAILLFSAGRCDLVCYIVS